MIEASSSSSGLSHNKEAKLVLPKLVIPPPTGFNPNFLSPGTGEVASWKIHLLQLVNEAPKPNPIYSKETAVIFTGCSRGGSSTDSLCYSKSTTDSELHMPPSYASVVNLKDGENSENSQNADLLSLKRKRYREKQARIQSLRLEIGDLSIAENLEKVCDHYFQLDQRSSQEQNESPLPSTTGDSLIIPQRPKLKVESVEVVSSGSSLDVGENSDESNDGSISSSSDISHYATLERREEFPEEMALGEIFHGLLTKSETEKLLVKDGDFLVRQVTKENGFILSFRFDDEIGNYRIICEMSAESSSLPKYYLEDRKKPFKTLESLVEDGLTTLYLDMKAGFYVDIMTELAQINKHDSMLLRSPSSSASIQNSRKNSAIIAFSRQISQIRLSSRSFSRNSSEMELKQHCFLPLPLEKKAKCQICLKGSFKAANKKSLTCRDCEMIIHENCMEKVYLECEPDLSKIPQIFGTDLTTLVKASGNAGKYKPPFVLVKCIEEIELRGIQSEGIYRVSGYQEMITQLQHTLEKDREEADMGEFSDLNSVCGVVKLFLRRLPEPLITKEVFDSFLKETGFLTLEGVKENMKSLPAAHKITSRYLFEHLHRVSKEHRLNKMSAFNLSSVLAPSIIVPEEMSLNTLKMGTDLVEIMIKNINRIFE